MIQSALEELAQASSALYQHMQAAAEAAGGEAGAEAAGATTSGGDDDIIDADFEKKE